MNQTDTAGRPDWLQLYEQQALKCAEQDDLIASLRRENRLLRLRDAPMPGRGYELLTDLQYKVRSLTFQLGIFKSGRKYTDMKAESDAQLAGKDREIKKLKAELAAANARTVTVRSNWSDIFDDLEKAHRKELGEKDRRISGLEKKLLAAQMQLDAEREKCRNKLGELYKVKTELEEEKGKNLKLTAQINRDYENSSKPSSQSPNHKKIANSREKTGKLPGAQPGHKRHPRKRHAPTETVSIPPPEEYLDAARYTPTGRTITKQMVEIRLELAVTEYSTPEFRDRLTRGRVHAEFPEGVADDVNYGGSIKALAFLLNNFCNVSLAKVSGFISGLTGGELNISTGMINGLSEEFSLKTEAERKKAFADILLSPVMHTDFTTARVSGKNMNVAVCATPDAGIVLYFAREHKGHEGVKDTPVEDYQNTLIHDHDRTFYNYGGRHQECLSHPLRYLKDSTENEPGLKWNGLMRSLIREMIHFWNGLDPGDRRDPDAIAPETVAGFEARYDKILETAKEEYEYEPPTKYYVEGYNLYKRMQAYRDSHLLFLHDRRVSPTNNLSERLLRTVKRKQAQVMAFRSWGGLDCLCDSLGPVAMLSAHGGNLYESVAAIFALPKN